MHPDAPGTGSRPTLILEVTVAGVDDVWALCHGRGGAYLDALHTASREELEAARQHVHDYQDAYFPVDAARRLDQIAAALQARIEASGAP